MKTEGASHHCQRYPSLTEHSFYALKSPHVSRVGAGPAALFTCNAQAARATAISRGPCSVALGRLCRKLGEVLQVGQPDDRRTTVLVGSANEFYLR